MALVFAVMKAYFIYYVYLLRGQWPMEEYLHKDSTTFFKQITAGSFLYQHVEN